MARNALNKERSERAIRQHVETLKIVLNTDDAVKITAFEYFVQTATVYAILCRKDDASFDATIQTQTHENNAILERIKTLQKCKP